MIIDVMRRNRHKLRKHKVFLFGSRATGSARKQSDFDIGVYGQKPLPLRDFYDIETQLDELPTLYKIDWVDVNKASTQFRGQAMQRTEVLYE